MEIGTLLDKDETAVFKACYDNSLEKESNIIDVREATRTIVAGGIIVEKEGKTHEELMREIQPYLQKRGLIKFQGFKATAIDDAGIDKVERELLGQPKWTVEARATSEKVDLSFIADARIKTIVERDYAELQNLNSNKTAKSVLVTSGGIIEGLLLDAIVTSGHWTYIEASERF